MECCLHVTLNMPIALLVSACPITLTVLCVVAEPLTFDGLSDIVTISVDQTKFSLHTAGRFSFRTRQSEATLVYFVSGSKHLGGWSI